MKRNKSYFLNGVVVLLSIVVALLIGELVVRIFIVTPVEYVIKDPVVGHKYLPNININKRDAESKKEVNISINSEGYRDKEHKLEKPPGVFRIAVLGDSFVAGTAVEQEELFTTLLEKNLNNNENRLKFEVFNFGVSGYGTAQEYLALKEYGLKYSPDLVIQFFFIGNDVWDNSKDLSNSRPVYFELDNRGNLRKLPVSKTRQKSVNWLNKYSRLYLWQKGAVNKLVQAFLYSFLPKHTVTKFSVDPEWYIFSAHYTEKWKKAWKLTQKLILAVKKECEDHGCQYLLVSIPMPHQVYDDYWKSTSEKYETFAGIKWDRIKPERILERFTEEEKINYISLLPLFQQDHQQFGKRVSFGSGHFSEYGHSVVANILLSRLAIGI